MLWKRDRLFCDINPVFYKISRQKEIIKRHLKNLFRNDRFAVKRQKEKLPNTVHEHTNNLIKRAKGVDITTQLNKAVNIELACRELNGLLIGRGETFSFWKIIGDTTEKKGYKAGRVLVSNRLKPGIGGGLCNLANSIHLVVLHSQLEVTEFHGHSDALAPDEGKRVPFGVGTSVSYNYIDYRFKNTTDQDFQLLCRCEDEKLIVELRSERELPFKYRLVEEDHHFRKENENYYRISKIYREIIDRKTDREVKKELILDNHSKVMFDYSLIPEELIRN